MDADGRRRKRAGEEAVSAAVPLSPVTGHPREFADRASDTASVEEHRERPLRVFAIDPSRGGNPRNVVTLRIPYEKLDPGPVGRQIAIIDEVFAPTISDEPQRKLATYPAVDLDAKELLLSGGLEPSEMDLQSHQQMVYAVAMRTIGAFERALNRQVRWPWTSDQGTRIEDRLRIYPHAEEMANAFYDATKGSMYLGYFHSGDIGGTRSSRIVYTALSYDIVAHEIVHPIVEALFPALSSYSEDAAPLHEGFADIVAMFQHFDFHDLVVDAVQRTAGRIHCPELAADLDTTSDQFWVQAELAERNPLLEIGGQFGEAVGQKGPLRLGLGKPEPTAYEQEREPHARGAILLQAVFDAFITVYARRTADLRRIARVRAPDTSISVDLALRMAAEATKTAHHFLTICIRALDDWPSGFDVGPENYLRALIASDADAVPDDEWGYRDALIASFRARGIVPKDVTSLSEDGLRWRSAGKGRSGLGRRPKRVEGALPDINRETRVPVRRTLKTFAFDPSMGKSGGNRLDLSIPYEELKPGPVGGKIAVIDYDASNDRYYTSVDLDRLDLLQRGGLDPSDVEPLFHQQMVYAVTMSTIERFESALGRPIRWPWAGGRTTGELGDRLRIYPHAMQEANAYYDRRQRGLLFGYFAASEGNPGRNLPGQIVYTCLSADIVAHETTHALLDSVQPYFLESTGPDAPAFHEAFADVIALLGHFSYKEALLDTIRRTGGLIQRDLLNPDAPPVEGVGRTGAERAQHNPLVGLALQFGESLGNRAALRAALPCDPDPTALAKALEAHDRGAILVAGIFDAFFSVYLRRSADLLRIGRAGGAITPFGDIHPDLAERLAREASDTATRVAAIATRALDYCPPVDVEFGDYLRALVTADYERAPDDPLGFRESFIEGFRARGIYARSAWSMSEEALRWDRLSGGDPVPGVTANTSTTDALRRNAIALRTFAAGHPDLLGLDPTLPPNLHSIQASTSEQLDRSGETRTEIRAQIVQQRKVPLVPEDPRSPAFTFRGGCTLILDGEGHLRYVIKKPISSESRLRRQRGFLCGRVAEAAATGYRGAKLTRTSLASLHRGL